jgi:acetyl-CoA synthetase
MAMRPGKVGVALPGAEADVLDENRKPVPPGVGGRLVLKRPFPHMLRTVWQDPARYERDWQIIPGCYVTGDVATRDKDGYIAVLGRYDDVLNVAGHRIGTAEVESALVSHPAVAEAAAIGVPDPMKGETIKVFVQVRSDHVASDALAATLIEHVRRELGPIATPSSLEFVTSLPKTRSGKIMRRVLKAKETGDDLGDVSTMEG